MGFRNGPDFLARLRIKCEPHYGRRFGRFRGSGAGSSFHCE